MKGSLPKVLMLGWEFPPVINGGLGVACHDLSVAMSQLADLTMIVPKASPDFKIRNLNLIGLNNLDADQFQHYPSNYHKPLPFKLHEIPFDLDPYSPDITAGKENDNIAQSLSIEKMLAVFKMNNLYDQNIIHHVMQYADLTAMLATKLEFDVIHAHDWMTMIAGIKIKQYSGKPLVVQIHSLEVDRSGENSRGWVFDLEKKGMEYADLLVPVSNFTAENISRYYGISKSKMAVVHNGSSNVVPFSNARSFKEKMVLFVGRLTRQKGPEKFVEIAGKVLEKNPGVRFVMAGVGDYFKRVLDQSSYDSLGNRFHLTGFLNQEKLKYLLSISDIYCMPSVSEPFGLSAIEAAQFGIPCVISKQSGVSEVLSGSLKFDHWDVNKAADCILRLLDDEVLRKKVVDDAFTNLNNISWNFSAQKIMNAYSSKSFI